MSQSNIEGLRIRVVFLPPTLSLQTFHDMFVLLTYNRSFPAYFDPGPAITPIDLATADIEEGAHCTRTTK